jgi:hypothetical protein
MGRFTGDDEDVCGLFHQYTVPDAKAQFRLDLMNAVNVTGGEMAELAAAGEGVVIVHVLSSDAPIKREV